MISWYVDGVTVEVAADQKVYSDNGPGAVSKGGR